MSENRNCFTYIWKIKNFKFSYGKSEINSPIFNVSQKGYGHSLALRLFPKSNIYPGNVACHLWHVSGGMTYFNYELSFIAPDGSVLHSEKFFQNGIVEGKLEKYFALRANRDVLYTLKKHMFTLNDVLTICCKILDNHESRRYYAESVIETECRSLVGTIEKFSCLESGENHPVSIETSETESFLSSLNLCLDTNGKLDIEIKPVDSVIFSQYSCTLFILDAFGKKVKIGEGEFRDKCLHCIPLTLLRQHIIEKKVYYLSNDKLTIECEIVFPSGSISEIVHDPHNVFDNQAIQENIFKGIETKLFSKEYDSNGITTMKDDLYTLFRQDILCDSKLETATETFAVHKNILSARSPVFKCMFTTDMREKQNPCVVIDDLDANTVRRMLDFMYLDTLDNVDYEDAKSLYNAADKYGIDALKYKCSNILMQNILLTNCCEILIFADRHKDTQLKNAFYDFFDQNASAVRSSDEWKNLEKNQSQLAIEAYRTLHMKKQEC